MPDKKLTEGTTPIDYEGTLKSLTESYYNALDSINRLQAQNDKLYETIDYRADKITELEDKLKTAKAEIERLEAEIDKQYEIAEANVRAEIASGGTSCHWCEDKVRAEAYKECIEKVKAEINKHSYGVLHKTVINFKLDNLLKELVGDNQ